MFFIKVPDKIGSEVPAKVLFKPAEVIIIMFSGYKTEPAFKCRREIVGKVVLIGEGKHPVPIGQEPGTGDPGFKILYGRFRICQNKAVLFHRIAAHKTADPVGDKLPGKYSIVKLNTIFFAGRIHQFFLQNGYLAVGDLGTQFILQTIEVNEYPVILFLIFMNFKK